jgi:hypothetical protein
MRVAVIGMTDRKLLKQQYGTVFDAVTALLFEVDPMGINLGDNTGEYEPETGTILPRLAAAKSVDNVQTIVYEGFCHWFGESEAGPRMNYKDVSVKIWEAWRALFPGCAELGPPEG